MSDALPGPPPDAPPGESERTWGMLAHLSAFAGFLLPLAGIVIGPLVVWLAKRDRSAFVAAHAREALNFNITVLCGALVCLVLALVLIGVLLAAALFIAWLVLTLVAAIRASEGEPYSYPFSLRLVR